FSPLDNTAQLILASLFAVATITTLRAAPPSKPFIHCPRYDPSRLARNTTARAPWMNILRRYGFPRLLIPNSLVFPPVDHCPGTRPSQAENSRPFLKAAP